jgi:uncharacterized OsmC-like protein
MSPTPDPRQKMAYRVRGVSRPGGHGRIRCGATDVKADTGSVSDGFRPGPAELLCASLAACLLKNIERYSELLPFEYEAASIDVEAERRATPPQITRMRYRIEIITDEAQARVDLLHRNIRKYGTITNTLAAACELTGEMVARHAPDSSTAHVDADPTPVHTV